MVLLAFMLIWPSAQCAASVLSILVGKPPEALAVNRPVTINTQLTEPRIGHLSSQHLGPWCRLLSPGHRTRSGHPLAHHVTMKDLVQRTILLRVVAVLLLLIAGAEVYACDVSDACVSSTTSRSTGCDDPGGDGCLCCCHHVVPVIVFTLEPGEDVYQDKPPEPVIQLLSVSIPIDHPPQL